MFTLLLRRPIRPILLNKRYTTFCLTNTSPKWMPSVFRELSLRICKELITKSKEFKDSGFISCSKERSLIVEVKGMTTKSKDELESELTHILKKSLFFKNCNLFLVKGTPFLEDIEKNKPKKFLVVSFGDKKIEIDKIYPLFREFGKIKDIEVKEDKLGSKIAIIKYKDTNSAISARLCLHRLPVDDVSIYISYYLDGFAFKRYLKSSKILLLLLLSLVLGVGYSISDWVRVFILIAKFKVYEQIDLKKDIDPSYTIPVIKNSMLKLHNLLNKTPDALIYYGGPSGSGKHHVLEEVLRENKYQLWLNFEHLLNYQYSGREMLMQFEQQIGYFSIFRFLDFSLSLVQKGLMIATGNSPDFDSGGNLETRMNSILGSMTKSLVYLNLKITKVKSQDIPVIVIDNYSINSSKYYNLFQRVITQWAEKITERKLAHVIFVSDHRSSYEKLALSTDNISIMKVLQKDLKKEDCFNYINLFFPDIEKSNCVLKVFDNLGGRLSDINIILKKMQKELSVEESILTFIEKTTKDILYNHLNFGLFNFNTEEDTLRAWYLIKSFSKNKKIEYNKLKESLFFQNNPEFIRQYESKGLIEIYYKYGIAHEVRPSRPILYKCFNEILNNETIKNQMNILETRNRIKFLEKDLKSTEAELSELKNAENVNKAGLWWYKGKLKRSSYLIKKMNRIQTNIFEAERDLSNFYNSKRMTSIFE